LFVSSPSASIAFEVVERNKQPAEAAILSEKLGNSLLLSTSASGKNRLMGLT
jgi:hypothetical protein